MGKGKVFIAWTEDNSLALSVKQKLKKSDLMVLWVEKTITIMLLILSGKLLLSK